MGAVTADKGYPYPTGTDRVMDGDNAIQALAQTVDYSIQAGSTVLALVADTVLAVPVVFARPFAAAPIIMVTSTAGPPNANYSQFVWAGVPTPNGFSVSGKRSTTTTITVMWVAIGKPT